MYDKGEKVQRQHDREHAGRGKFEGGLKCKGREKKKTKRKEDENRRDFVVVPFKNFVHHTMLSGFLQAGEGWGMYGGGNLKKTHWGGRRTWGLFFIVCALLSGKEKFCVGKKRSLKREKKKSRKWKEREKGGEPLPGAEYLN